MSATQPLEKAFLDPESRVLGTIVFVDVVDTASRLCDVASPQAIFVDEDTVASAQMNRVSGNIGRGLDRTPSEYQGSLERTSLRGFPGPVGYYEIKWDQQLFGLKSRVMT